MNGWLVKLGRAPEPSKTQAVKVLKGIHINIFDLLRENFKKVHASVTALAWYTLKNELFFPLAKAKEENLREFLRQILVALERARRSPGSGDA